MLVVYIIVGLLNSIGLLIVVPHPFMFGFVFILTFIPYIGIMISSLLPIACFLDNILIRFGIQ
jgi:predicted PurR-regulated permease PerM